MLICHHQINPNPLALTPPGQHPPPLLHLVTAISVITIFCCYLYDWLISSATSSASSIQHPASNVQHPASNVQHPTSSVQHPTSSVQHPTSSIQHSAYRIQDHLQRISFNVDEYKYILQ